MWHRGANKTPRRQMQSHLEHHRAAGCGEWTQNAAVEKVSRPVCWVFFWKRGHECWVTGTLSTGQSPLSTDEAPTNPAEIKPATFSCVRGSSVRRTEHFPAPKKNSECKVILNMVAPRSPQALSCQRKRFAEVLLLQPAAQTCIRTTRSHWNTHWHWAEEWKTRQQYSLRSVLPRYQEIQMELMLYYYLYHYYLLELEQLHHVFDSCDHVTMATFMTAESRLDTPIFWSRMANKHREKTVELIIGPEVQRERETHFHQPLKTGGYYRRVFKSQRLEIPEDRLCQYRAIFSPKPPQRHTFLSSPAGLITVTLSVLHKKNASTYTFWSTFSVLLSRDQRGAEAAACRCDGIHRLFASSKLCISLH